MKRKIQAYKGVRDFYPDDMETLNYIFDKWVEVVEKHGYRHYHASVLESLDLYSLKNQSNPEILTRQIYSFTDKGKRQVALRPEMTPTLARMVSARQRNLNLPIRWYSLPNLFRYENPQRGRLREHWQLNIDILGLKDYQAEFELIMIADQILKNFQASPTDYLIKISSRPLISEFLRVNLNLVDKSAGELLSLIDGKPKLEANEFKARCSKVISDEAFLKLDSLLGCDELAKLPINLQKHEAYPDLERLFRALREIGLNNHQLDLSIVRGFDYYTGIIFEIFDRHPDNQRSMFGGGRYDSLIDSLGGQPLPAAGFGMGDVTMLNFLTSHQLLPKFDSGGDLYVILIDIDYPRAYQSLETLRNEGLKVVVDNRPLTVNKRLAAAAKQGFAQVLFVGLADLQEGLFNLRNMLDKSEQRLSLARVISYLLKKE